MHDEVVVIGVTWDTAACRHAQDDGSTEYIGLEVRCTINGEYRRLFLRTRESGYPGNQAMIQIIQSLEVKGECHA